MSETREKQCAECTELVDPAFDMTVYGTAAFNEDGEPVCLKCARAVAEDRYEERDTRGEREC